MPTNIPPTQSSDFFARLVADAGEGIWVLDRDYRTIYLNTRMAEMLGGEVADFAGAELWAFMDAGERAEAERNLSRQHSQSRVNYELQIKGKHGGSFWVEFSAAPLLDSNSQVIGTSVFVIDISWRKAAELALTESERAYREVFECSDAIKLMLDPATGGIIAANAAARQYYGYSAAEFSRLHINQINILSDAEIKQEMARAQLSERNYFLFRHRLKSGEVRDVEVRSNPITVGGREILYSIVHDIGKQTAAERNLQLTRFAFEHAQVAAVWIGPDGEVLDANTSACELMQRPLDDMIGKSVTSFCPDVTEPEWLSMWQQTKTTQSHSFKLKIALADGQRRPVEVHATHLEFEGERFIVVYARDILEKSQADDLLALQHRLLESLAAGQPLMQVLDATVHGVERLAPGVICSILLVEDNRLRSGAAPGLSDTFNAAINGLAIGPKVGSCGTAAYFNQAIEVHDIATDPLWAEYKDLAAREHVAACWSTPILGSDGRVLGTFAFYYRKPCEPEPYHRRIVDACTHLVGIAIEHREAEARVHTLAFYDALTGLPNRSLFADRVELALAHAHRTKSPLALLFVDLDRFKTINDSLGHAVGDRLLTIMAHRIEGVIRESDTVCRQGGDEFILLLNDCDAAGASQVAQKVIAATAERIEFDEVVLNCSASVGIALYPGDGQDYDTLFKHADAAMYRSKDMGRNAYCFYQKNMAKDAGERLEVEAALRLAITRGELLLHYQPQIQIADGSLYGLEALVRWQHPVWGLVSPARFIPIAEESGLIDAVGTWVLNEACRQMAAWRELGMAPAHISVNLSAGQFQHGDVPALVAETLARHALPASMLTLEITESLMVVDGNDKALEALKALDAMGISLAIDDFGTGYSSLGYLKRFPVSELKLDQSFVRDLNEDEGDRALASAVVRIGQSLRLTVVAEGVETAEQLGFLHSQGCDVAQGYFFAKPMSPIAFGDWLNQQPSPSATAGR